MRNTLLLGALFSAALNTNASIVYTDIPDATLASQGSLDIDFNGDNTPEFTFEDGSFGGPVEPSVFFNPDCGFVMAGTFQGGSGWDVITGVTANTTIDANSNFANNGVDGYIDPFWDPGTFPTGADAYIGATFQLGGNTHYGWIRVNWDGNGTFTVLDFAYEDTADASIDAGDEGGTSTASLASQDIQTELLISGNMISVKTKAEIESIKVLDANGKHIDVKAGESTIDMTGAVRGMYVLFVQYTDQSASTHKFVY